MTFDTQDLAERLCDLVLAPMAFTEGGRFRIWRLPSSLRAARLVKRDSRNLEISYQTLTGCTPEQARADLLTAADLVGWASVAGVHRCELPRGCAEILQALANSAVQGSLVRELQRLRDGGDTMLLAYADTWRAVQND